MEMISTSTNMANMENDFPGDDNGPNVLPILGQNKNDNDDGGSLSSAHRDSKTQSNSKRPRGNSNDEKPKDDEREDKEEKEDSDEPKGKRRKKGKKPMDMPRRALSAYNIFFSEQRKLILEEIDRKERQGTSDGSPFDMAGVASLPRRNGVPQPNAIPCVVKQRRSIMTRTKRPHRKVHGKISLVVLAREVGKRWKELSDDDRKYYEDLAEEDKMRHKQAMNDYKERKAAEGMLKITQHHHLAPWQQQQHHLASYPGMGAGMGAGMGSGMGSGMGMDSMDDGMFMNMMMNNNDGYPSQQLPYHPRQHQQHRHMDMMGQDNSNLYQDALMMELEQKRQQQKRRHMLANLIGGGNSGEYGGNLSPSGTFGGPPPPPPRPHPQPTQPSGPNQGSNPDNVFQLTDMERMMIMKGRAAAAEASTKAMMQFASTQGGSSSGNSNYSYRGLNSSGPSRTTCVS